MLTMAIPDVEILAGCTLVYIVFTQYTSLDRETDRQNDDSIMPIADHTVTETV